MGCGARKAQASVEYIVILSVALFVLLIVVVLASERLVGITVQKKYNDARNTVADLAKGCDEVYQQGIGAKKRVYIVMPVGTDFSNTKTYIGKPAGYSNATAPRTINIHVDGTDVYAESKEDVYGTFPQSEGGSFVWVESRGTYCSIGQLNLDVDAASVYVLMSPSSSASKTVTVYNNANVSFNVTIMFDWVHAPTVSLSANDTFFELAALSNRPVGLSFTSSASSTGVYSGRMFVAANGSGINEAIAVPITVDVVSETGGGGGSNCTPLGITTVTYNDSGYTLQSSSFKLSENVIITSGNWTPGDTVTLNLFLNSLGPGSPVSGFPRGESVDGAGEFGEMWNTAGAAAGTYNATVNDSTRSASYLFTINGCS